MNVLKNLLLLSFSSYLILLFIEIFFEFNKVRNFKSLKLISNDIDEEFFYYDANKKINKLKFIEYQNIKEQGLSSNFFFNIYDLNNVNNFNIFPLAYKPDTFIISCLGDDELRIGKTDKNGFFNKNEYYKDADTILLGDSYVAGQCVNEDYQINTILNKDKVKFLSYGLPGSSILKQFAVLKEYISEIETKKILLFVLLDNDFKEIIAEYKNPFLKKYLEGGYSQNLNKKNDKIKIIYEKLNNEFINELKSNDFIEENFKYIKYSFFKYKELVTLYNIRKVLGINKTTIINYNGLNLYIETLTKMHDFLKNKKINMSIFLIGSDFKIRSTTLSEKYIIKKLESFSDKNNIKFINLINKMKEENFQNFYDKGPHPVYKQPGHPNKIGYNFMASEIREFLNEK